MNDQSSGAGAPTPSNLSDLNGIELPVPAPDGPMVPRQAQRPPAAMRMREKRKAPDGLRDALLTQLKSILDKPLNPKSLLELEQTARLAHQLLIVSGDPRAMPQRRRGGYPGPMPYGVDPLMGDVIGADDMDDEGFGIPPVGALDAVMAGAPGAENFGAAAIREMMSEAKAPRIDDLMRSLQIAEKNDMRDIADKLRKQVEAQLGMGQDEDVQPVEPVMLPEGA